MKRAALLALLVAAASALAAETLNETGRQLIMGWNLEGGDSDWQTNAAIEAVLDYTKAARRQMETAERHSPSCRIELYRATTSYRGDGFVPGFFLYINSRSKTDYRDRYIEINFYIWSRGEPALYTLVLYYNNYDWMRNNSEKNMWELTASGERALEFFVYELNKFRR